MGESDKPRCAYDFDELSDDLGAVIETLGLRDVVLVAWSMGTTVSLRYLERGGAGVRGLVIVNGPLRLTRAADFPHAMTEDELAGYMRELRDSWPAGEREFQAQTLLDPVPAVVDWLYAIALQTPLDVALRLVENQAELDMRARAGRARESPCSPPTRPTIPTTRRRWRVTSPSTRRAGEYVLFEKSRHCIPIEEANQVLPRTEGVRLNHAEQGQGMPVVLLHQTPRSVDEYRDVMPVAGRARLPRDRLRHARLRRLAAGGGRAEHRGLGRRDRRGDRRARDRPVRARGSPHRRRDRGRAGRAARRADRPRSY